MKSPAAIWRGMTRAERVVVALALLAIVGTVALAIVGLTKKPGDVYNPDAAFKKAQGAGNSEKAPVRRTINWPRFGYDPGRSKFLDAQRVKPPFAKLWKYDGGELIELPPIYVDGRLYFIDNDGLYVALDAKTGKVIWKKRLTRLNASSPTYQDGVLYSVSLEPGQALAVRARDGKVLWRKDLGVRAESAPFVRGDRMYFGDEGGTLYALDTKNGSVDWSVGLAGSIKGAPAFDDGTLFVGDYGGKMNAIRASDGAIRWQTQDLGTGFGHGRFYSTAAVAFGRVYAGNADDKVYSFDEKTGEIAWTYTAGNYVYSGVAAADTKGTKPAVYFGSHDKYAYALDAKSGDVIWKEKAGGQVSGPATVIGDVVYLSTFTGNHTIGFDLGSGRRVFSYDDGEYGPALSDGQNLYVTGGATVTAFAPVDLGGFKYKPKKEQKGIVPPAQRRRAKREMRKRQAEGPAKEQASANEKAGGNEQPGGKKKAGEKKNPGGKKRGGKKKAGGKKQPGKKKAGG
jgi:outer membrane protein assembly factor BamB